MSRKHSNLAAKKQAGYVLLAILFALTVLIIALAAAAPNAAKMAQRAKEEELIRRGEQYALGIRRFYKKFGRYPSNMDQLENTNNIRFLRRKYLDPMTGKDDWQPIQFGQARPALGFFGQKITTTGGQSPSGPGIGPSTIGTGMGATSPSSATSSPSSPSSGATATTPSPSGGNPTPSPTAADSSAATATTPDGKSPAGPSGSAGNPISSDQLTGKSFGGGSIVGVSIPSQKESLKEFQQKNHYNEWQFVYDPTLDPTMHGGTGAGAATGVPGATGAPGVPQSGFGQPGFGQPGLGQPGFGQPGSGPVSPANPNPTANPTSPGTTPTNPH